MKQSDAQRPLVRKGAEREVVVAVAVRRGLSRLSCSSQACACLCFQLAPEFTAGTGEGSHREVNGLQDKGQSCWEKKERGEKSQVVEKEEKNGAKETDGQDREGLIVKGKESANKCEVEIGMVKQELCVCVCRNGDSGLTQP